MRVGFDAKRIFNNKTGLGNYSRRLLNNLLDYAPQDWYYYCYTPKRKLDVSQEAFTQSNRTYVRTPKHNTFNTWRSFGIRTQFRKDNIDIFHGLSHEIPFPDKNRNYKTIVSIHDIMYKILPHTYSWVDRQLYQIKYNNSIKNADKIIAVSHNTKSDIHKYFNVPVEKIEVITNTTPFFEKNGLISDSTIQKNVKATYKLPPKFLLYVGTVEKRKNLELIIQSYAHLKKDFQIPLVIIGASTDYKRYLLQLIDKLNIKHLIIWLDNQIINQNQLLAFFQLASILIYPSHYEGFGLPLTEALFCKLPVISSNVSALPEAGGPHSIYVDSQDAETLATSIENILANEQLASSMQEKGYAYAKSTFSAALQTKKLINLYQNMLS